MKRIAILFAIVLSLGGCSGGKLASLTNPATPTNLYAAELVFDGSLKTFNELKGLCARRVLPPVCRTYVTQGQDYIRKIAAADVAANNFVENNPTLDATNVIQAFTGLISDFNTTVNKLSATTGAK